MLPIPDRRFVRMTAGRLHVAPKARGCFLHYHTDEPDNLPALSILAFIIIHFIKKINRFSREIPIFCSFFIPLMFNRIKIKFSALINTVKYK